MLKIKKIITLLIVLTLIVTSGAFFVSATSQQTSYSLGSSATRSIYISGTNWNLTARGVFNKGGLFGPDSMTTSSVSASGVSRNILFSNWNNGAKTVTTYDFQPAHITGTLWVATTSTLHRLQVTSATSYTTILGTATITGSN
ncbi:MAG: hypothetical protein LBC71_09105 [Oscillospiraceae bacterium]|jgi:hypothetical protein|nr:hypothetical protein [Oscillospiraceae bacterium]